MSNGLVPSASTSACSGGRTKPASVVLEEAARGLGGEPLAHVALLGAGAGGELVGETGWPSAIAR